MVVAAGSATTTARSAPAAACDGGSGQGGGVRGREGREEADCRTKGKLRWLIMYHKPTTTNYIISVAFMKNLTSFSAPTLDDYAPPVNADPAGR
ncbi:hypothetical protein PR202_ga31148 [Eleusine coracana subsp. coracana]|uniref:Uncharacterized protein n=1 Tax=Eleusine coracana subsp. coracana TaxID=191504 RepID=A0AAV5DQ98_ELECO|nr:hypothetical protein PR202_ga31148 [Eleusine coracana subsp. coracana]